MPEDHHSWLDRNGMNIAEWNRLSPRGQRALGLMALAMLVIITAGLVYLHPIPQLRQKSLSPSIVLPPVSRQSDQVSYDFVTPRIGWALVVTGGTGPAPRPFSVFRTEDGAKHWQEQFTMETSLLGRGPQSVQFFDKTNGYVVIGGPSELVYRTTDGGADWHQVGLPQLGLVSFSDPSSGWLLAPGESLTDPAANLYSTDNGGINWLRLPDPPTDVAASVTFRQPSEGWIGSRGDPLPHVYASGDGGRSWNRHDLPIPADGLPGGAIASVSLLPGAGVVAFLDGGAGPSFALTSFDGGASWKSVSPRPLGQSRGDLFGFQDAFHWCVMDVNSVYRTSDAGQTWSQVSSLQFGGLYFCQFVDSRHGWGLVADAGRGNGLALTADGGLHWTRAAVPQPG